MPRTVDIEVGNVWIGTPTYGGELTTRYFWSLLQTFRRASDIGLDLQVVTIEHESLVPRARNGIAARFLADPKASHLVFIDADIEWRADDFVRLLAHDVDVVCGIYPKKTLPIEFALHPLTDRNGEAERDPETGRVEIDKAATGFLCIKRHVLQRMIDAGAVDKIEKAAGVPEDELAWYYDFFPVGVRDGVYLSEDYGFSWVWRRLGGRIWADPAIVLGHVGKYVYAGDPAQLWRERE